MQRGFYRRFVQPFEGPPRAPKQSAFIDVSNNVYRCPDVQVIIDTSLETFRVFHESQMMMDAVVGILQCPSDRIIGIWWREQYRKINASYTKQCGELWLRYRELWLRNIIVISSGIYIFTGIYCRFTRSFSEVLQLEINSLININKDKLSILVLVN